MGNRPPTPAPRPARLILDALCTTDSIPGPSFSACPPDSKTPKAQAPESNSIQVQVPAPPLLKCKSHSWHLSGLSAGVRCKQVASGAGVVTWSPVCGLKHHCHTVPCLCYTSVSFLPWAMAVLGHPWTSDLACSSSGSKVTLDARSQGSGRQTDLHQACASHSCVASLSFSENGVLYCTALDRRLHQGPAKVLAPSLQPTTPPTELLFPRWPRKENIQIGVAYFRGCQGTM